MISNCIICGEAVKDLVWFWGDNSGEPAHMECVLKEADYICLADDCGCLYKGDDDSCPECGDKSRELTEKDKKKFREKEVSKHG